jgi:hypothetical protein
MLLLLTQKVFLRETHVFLQLSWTGLSGANRYYPHLKHLSCRSIPWKKLPQFSQGNTTGCLWHDTCVFSTHLNRPIWNKMSLSPPWKLWFAGSILTKLNSVLTGKQCPACSSSNTGGFLWRDIYVSSTHLSSPIWNIWAFLHCENYDFQQVLLSKTNSVLTGQQCTRCSC